MPVWRIQLFCEKEIIPWLASFGKAWTILNETEKKKDGRCKAHKCVQVVGE